MPSPAESSIIAAFDDDDELAGFWCIQVAYHAGPLWIAPKHRGTRLWASLHEALCRTFAKLGGTGFYSFCGQPKVESIFKALGYTDLGYTVWKKEIK